MRLSVDFNIVLVLNQPADQGVEHICLVARVEVDSIDGRDVGHLSVVTGRVEAHDVAEVVDDVYEGQEEVSLQAVFVQVVGYAVASEKYEHATLEKRREEAWHQHGVGYVDHLELVKEEDMHVGD